MEPVSGTATILIRDIYKYTRGRQSMPDVHRTFASAFDVDRLR